MVRMSKVSPAMRGIESELTLPSLSRCVHVKRQACDCSRPVLVCSSSRA